MLSTLARAAYTLLLHLGTLLYFARLWWRGAREPMYRVALGERLGFYKEGFAPGRLWIHAVSLGETRAAGALIEALRSQQPDLRILLTHGTATGREAGTVLLRESDAQVWLPYDTPGAVRRFLRAHQPMAGVLMETEIWPNLIRACETLAIPIVLANARLSQRSLQKGLQLQALFGPAMKSLALVLAQTDADARRLRQGGAPKVQVMGNLKFDMTPNSAQLAQGQAWHAALGRNVVLMAVSRDGEEAALLSAWAAVPVPRPLLVIAPRHPQRFDAVAALASARFKQVARRSSWADMPPESAVQADVWIGDTLGEMALYYALADVALLGGSFEPLGGHNLIEAAACGCPLLMGPHTLNFAQAAEMALAAGAAQRLADITGAVRRATELAISDERDRMSAQALSFAQAHRGAAARMARQVLAVSEQPRLHKSVHKSADSA